ncbi:MAG: hypothetical protein GWP05_00325 [Anaerolineaceae bacterium]|nr:hypothetical protein [Anaerolineaceae bacterium]
MQDRPRIGIVGFGFVGRSMKQLFGDDAVTYDINDGSPGQVRINACDVAFVCVPTPVSEDGACDTSIVEECVGWIDAPQIVIRSTVKPGTTERLRRETGKPIIFQPEYIGETPAHPLVDASKHDFIILGGPIAEVSAVADLYARHYHSNVRFHFTDSTTAEVAKYMENSFYAMKVMFCNEFFDIAAAHGVDYNELREMWLADPRISRDHTFVYPDNRGFSGKCLPKDVLAIISSSLAQGAAPALLQAIMAINERHRVDDPTYTPYRGKAPANAVSGG